MSLSIQQAAEKAVQLGKQLKAVIEVGEFLEEVGSFKNAHTEAEKMAKKARFDQKKAEEACDKVCKELKAAEEKHVQVQKGTKALLEKTEVDRAAFIKVATTQSMKVVSDAKAEADGIISKAQADITFITRKKTELMADCEKLTVAYNGLKADMAKLKDRLG